MAKGGVSTADAIAVGPQEIKAVTQALCVGPETAGQQIGMLSVAAATGHDFTGSH